RLADRVVVTDAWPAEGGRHPEPLQGREHCRALHGPAVVGVQDELAGLDVLGRARRSDQGGRELHRLLLVDVPADDLAAPDVEDEVEVVEGPADTRTEVGDVP